MPLTDRQRRLYASAPSGEMSLPGLTLAHSAFTGGAFHLTTHYEAFEADVDVAGQGEVQRVSFQPHPFEVALPEIGAEGRADARLDIWNSGPEFTAEVLAAARVSREPIAFIYNAYFAGDPASQIDTIRLQMGDVALTPRNVSARVTSTDVYNLPFPLGAYTRELFRGLDR